MPSSRKPVRSSLAATRAPKLVIVDEPTDLLSYPYQQRLLALIQAWCRIADYRRAGGRNRLVIEMPLP